MISSDVYPGHLIQQGFIIPGAEKHLQLIGPGAEYAYTRVTTHEFAAAVPHEKMDESDVNADEDQAGTQPDNNDHSRADDADADQASTRKGTFQPEDRLNWLISALK